MNKNVFIDTNVILDFVLCRDGEQNATDIFQLGENGDIRLSVSFLTMANVAYVARKHRTREELYAYLRELAPLFTILQMNEQLYHKALEFEAPDFEDYLQYLCAKEFNCDLIITNNTKHFSFSDISVLTPAEFLDSIGMK